MIEAENLGMRFGSFLAVDGASFRVEKGEVAGLLGPNGAGKSSTMRILTTFLAPSSGTARVAGFSIENDPIEVRRRIGYLPENPPLYLDMETAEYLEFVGRSRGLGGDALRRRLAWASRRCGLEPVFRTPIRFLSKGFRQRTGLAQALIHDPEVVILDEPTSGLDPHQIHEIRALVAELAENKTVILSTHILQEAEAMAGRVIIISQGRITGQGTREELRRQAGRGGRVEFAVQAARGDSEEAIGKLPGVEECRFQGEGEGVCRYLLAGGDEAEIVFRAGGLAREKGWRVAKLAALPFTLEETFLALTAGEKIAQKGETAA
ncbi:MAG: ABC transporter ATP-binding protein [Planctomycetota bacterium]|jgi:ABC-2 type transport system ATP-binding protein|nr:ABC transporter ATP-binding protein [Planctomycetota bacterium]